MIKRISIIILSLGILALAGAYIFAFKDRLNPYEFTRKGRPFTPQFTQARLPAKHHYDAKKALPFVGSGLIDIDGSGNELLFIGGGHGQQDGLYAFHNNKFVNVIKGKGLERAADDVTYGVLVVDATGDGLDDLFVARQSGVYLYTNRGGKFEAKKLDIPLTDRSTPLSLAAADLNQDGHVDLFISAFIKVDLFEPAPVFNRENYGAKSLLLLNNGDNTFRDVTDEAGLDFTHNTFQALFVDLDGDHLQDLVVAYNTGQARIYRNKGNVKFELVDHPHMKEYYFPMGIAAGDYDHDGHVDLFFSNMGKSIPPSLARGDLRDDQVLNPDWILLKNLGGFKFKSAAEATKTRLYEFSWGALFQDFNLDGLLDLVVAENYVKYIFHRLVKLPGRFLLQREDHTFEPLEGAAKVLNYKYGITPLTADFNRDGAPDLVWVNVKGNSRAFINEAPRHGYLKLTFPRHPRFIGSMVQVISDLGDKYYFHLPAQGLLSSQSHSLIVGLGGAKEIRKVIITDAHGKTVSYPDVRINSTLKVS